MTPLERVPPRNVFVRLLLFCALIFFGAVIATAQETTDRMTRLQADIDLLKLENAKLQQQKEVLANQLSIATTKADLADITSKQTAANQAAIATAKATQAQQEAAALTAAFPTNKVTPLTGTTTVDKDYAFPPLVLAYSASEQLVSDLAIRISVILQSRRTKSNTAPRLLIYQATDTLPAQRAAYAQILRRVQSITDTLATYETRFKTASEEIKNLPEPKLSAAIWIDEARAALATPTPTPTGPLPTASPIGRMGFLPALETANEGLTAVNGTLQTVIQLISLFRTDTTIATVPVTIDMDALAAQFGHCLQDSTLAPIIQYPSLLLADDSIVLKTLGEMKNQESLVSPRSVDIDNLILFLTARQLEVEEQIKRQLPLGTPPSDELAKIAALATRKSKDYQQANMNRLIDLKQRIVALDQIALALDKSLQTVDDKTGIAPLSSIVKTEALVNALSNPNTYSVQLKIVAGGGATKIDKNLFTGSKLSQLGGAIFVTTLSDSKGKILFTNLSKGFLGYSRLKSTGGVVQQDLMPQKVQTSSRR